MNTRALVGRLVRQEGVNFVLTNYVPRRLLTRFMGWFSRIEQPLVRDVSLNLWRFFADVDLGDAKKLHFSSVHDCFTRELRNDARPIDSDPTALVSPCDAIVGASGHIDGAVLIQAKGLTFTLLELLCDPAMTEAFRDGQYVTLRLTSGMYHRFHAPHDCRVEQVTYIAGDTWNVNPSAVKRVDKLFCKNERAVLRARLDATHHMVCIVPIAAILVASIRLRFLDILLHLAHEGPDVIQCNAPLVKGEEMGWFEHGSTIIVLAPSGFTLFDNVTPGSTLRMGQPLMRVPPM